jgi:heme exporter protein CcmB
VRPPPPSFARAALAVLRLDLRLERRAGDALLPALLFGALVLVLGGFALTGRSDEPIAAAAGCYWIAVALAGQLAVTRQWSREREDAAFDGLLLSPAPRAALLAGRAGALALGLVAVEAALALPALLLFRLDPGPEALWILPAALLAALGFAVIATLFGAMALAGSAADLLIGTAVFPLLIPPLLGAIEVTRSTLEGGGPPPLGWLALLIVFDLITAAGALWLFGHVVEE